ncbi:Condensin complex subunit 2 [Balamuthia mandrillaris]
MRNNTTARSCSSSKRRLSCAWGALASRTDSSSGAPPSPAKGEQGGTCDKENAPNNVAVVSFLEENDDAAEKRRARLKSLSRTSSVFNNINSPVATSRRVSIARRRSGAAARSSEQRTHLSGTQLRELYSNCIKLSAENKITQKNSWALNLIDHIDDVLQTQHQSAETESGVANFQAASCTLDASVKIYSCRVDSIHNEAYRVLGGLSRTAKERDTDSDGNGHEDGDGNGQDATAGQGNGPKRRRKAKANTLETNPEALQLKTFDLEFAVDPLFRKTSASFDEGGARGLLLNHICVYNLCDLVFDSTDAVLKAGSSISEDEGMNTPVKDLTALQQYILSDLSQLSSKQLCPGFEEFRSAFKEHQLPSGKIPSKQSFAEEAQSLLRLEEQLSGRVPPSEHQGGVGFFSRAERSFENTTDIEDANDDDEYDEGFFATGEVPLDHQPHGTSYIDATYLQTTTFDMAATVARDDGLQSLYEDDLQFLTGGEPALNWAGPTHWKYRSRTGTTKTNSGFSADGDAHSEHQTKQMLKKASRKRAFMIDFAQAASAINWSQAFSRSRAATTLSRAVQERTNEDSTTLPQDLHYDIRSLLHLFCKPNVSVASLRYVTPAASSDNRTTIPNPDATTDSPTLPFTNSGEEVIFESNAVTEAFGSAPASADIDDEDQPAEEFVDDGFQLDESFEASPPGEQKDKGLDLIEAPKQVEKISIRYASVAKKVDVMRLKSALWKEIIPPNKQDNKEEDECSLEPTFQQVLSSLAQKPNNRGLLSDVSVQYCFICLLHLANEKELELNPLVESTNALLQSYSSSADCGGEEPDSNLADFYSLSPAIDISISGCAHSDSC